MRPEQSKPFAAVPPHTYGVPSASSAVFTTPDALPTIMSGGRGGGRGGGALRCGPGQRRSTALPIVTDKPIDAAIPSREFGLVRQKPRGPTSWIRYTVSRPSAAQRIGRHSTPPPRVQSAASSCDDVSVETPNETPARAYGLTVERRRKACSCQPAP